MCVLCVDQKSKMAVTAGYTCSFKIGQNGKMKKKKSSDSWNRTNPNGTYSHWIVIFFYFFFRKSKLADSIYMTLNKKCLVLTH